jgi:hypothetical protein
MFKALFILPEGHVVPAQIRIGVHVGRVQGERAFGFRYRFAGAPVRKVDERLRGVSPGVIWIDGEGVRR